MKLKIKQVDIFHKTLLEENHHHSGDVTSIYFERLQEKSNKEMKEETFDNLH